MNKSIFIVCLFCLLSPFAMADDLDCLTEPTKENLTIWRDKAISTYGKGNYKKVSDALNRCFTDKTPACLKDLADELSKSRGESDFEFRIETPGQRLDPLTLKSEKDLPSEFLVPGFLGMKKDGLVQMPDNILELAKKKNWLALSYKTRSTGGFDIPPNLLMVVIPGRDKDIYIQTSPHSSSPPNTTDPVPTLSKNELSKGQNTMTIITVDKTVNPPVGQLRLLTKITPEKMMEEFNRGTPVEQLRRGIPSTGEAPAGYKWTNQLSISTCLECHSTPLRSISPIGYKVTNGNEKRMSPEDEETTTKINEMMVIDSISWGKLKTQSGKEINLGHDPSLRPMGWIPPTSTARDDTYLNQCATKSKKVLYRGFGNYTHESILSENPKIDLSKVRNAMDCTQCHNGTIRGNLNKHFSTEEVKFKILVDRSMPPGAELTSDERIALFNCLRAELRENRELDIAWRESGEWLKKEACTAPSTRRLNRMNLNPGSTPTRTTPANTNN